MSDGAPPDAVGAPDPSGHTAGPVVALDELLPCRHADIDVAAFEAAFVVFDPRSMQVHLIDGFAAVVFDACDGTTTRTALRAEFAEVTAMSPSDADDVIADALDQLLGLGLLAGTVPLEHPPCVGCSQPVGPARVAQRSAGRGLRWRRQRVG